MAPEIRVNLRHAFLALRVSRSHDTISPPPLAQFRSHSHVHAATNLLRINWAGRLIRRFLVILRQGRIGGYVSDSGERTTLDWHLFRLDQEGSGQSGATENLLTLQCRVTQLKSSPHTPDRHLATSARRQISSSWCARPRSRRTPYRRSGCGLQSRSRPRPPSDRRELGPDRRPPLQFPALRE